MTLCYAFYCGVIKRGRYTWEIKKTHELYGMPLLCDVVKGTYMML